MSGEPAPVFYVHDTPPRRVGTTARQIRDMTLDQVAEYIVELELKLERMGDFSHFYQDADDEEG